MAQNGMQYMHPGVAAHSLIALSSERWFINVKIITQIEITINLIPVFFLFIFLSPK